MHQKMASEDRLEHFRLLFSQERALYLEKLRSDEVSGPFAEKYTALLAGVEAAEPKQITKLCLMRMLNKAQSMPPEQRPAVFRERIPRISSPRPPKTSVNKLSVQEEDGGGSRLGPHIDDHIDDDDDDEADHNFIFEASTPKPATDQQQLPEQERHTLKTPRQGRSQLTSPRNVPEGDPSPGSALSTINSSLLNTTAWLSSPISIDTSQLSRLSSLSPVATATPWAPNHQPARQHSAVNHQTLRSDFTDDELTNNTRTRGFTPKAPVILTNEPYADESIDFHEINTSNNSSSAGSDEEEINTVKHHEFLFQTPLPKAGVHHLSRPTSPQGWADGSAISELDESQSNSGTAVAPSVKTSSSLAHPNDITNLDDLLSIGSSLSFSLAPSGSQNSTPVKNASQQQQRRRPVSQSNRQTKAEEPLETFYNNGSNSQFGHNVAANRVYRDLPSSSFEPERSLSHQQQRLSSRTSQPKDDRKVASVSSGTQHSSTSDQHLQSTRQKTSNIERPVTSSIPQPAQSVRSASTSNLSTAFATGSGRPPLIPTTSGSLHQRQTINLPASSVPRERYQVSKEATVGSKREPAISPDAKGKNKAPAPPRTHISLQSSSSKTGSNTDNHELKPIRMRTSATADGFDDHDSAIRLSDASSLTSSSARVNPEDLRQFLAQSLTSSEAVTVVNMRTQTQSGSNNHEETNLRGHVPVKSSSVQPGSVTQQSLRQSLPATIERSQANSLADREDGLSQGQAEATQHGRARSASVSSQTSQWSQSSLDREFASLKARYRRIVATMEQTL